jgi:hypothetical protein
VDSKYTEYPQAISWNRVDEATVERLRRMVGDDLRPDSMLRHRGVVRRERLGRTVAGASREEAFEPAGSHLDDRFFGVPEQVGMVEESGQLIDSLSQPLRWTELMQQGDYFPDHEKLVSITGIVLGLFKGKTDLWKDLVRRLPENEIEGGGAHAEI